MRTLMTTLGFTLLGCAPLTRLPESPTTFKAVSPPIKQTPTAPLRAQLPDQAPAVSAVPPENVLQQAPPQSNVCAALAAPPSHGTEAYDSNELPTIVGGERGLSHFHESVAQLLRGNRISPVRIAVYGDSNLTNDWLTGEMRRSLQLKYGDSGHGFVAIGRPWPWYRHTDVRHGLWDRAWRSYAVSTHPVLDRQYGFSGIAADSQAPGALAWVETADTASPVGGRASELEVFYLARPKGGSFDIRVDGATLQSISTLAGLTEAKVAKLSLADQKHRIELEATSAAPVRLLGVVLERSGPGFVVDSLGVGAASAPLFLNQNPTSAKTLLSARNYDLVLFLLGTNQVWPVKYEAWLGELVERHHQALPNASILVMTSPASAGVSKSNASVAQRHNAAFWDFQRAMGEGGSMEHLATQGMAWSDGVHLTEKGARYMGRQLLRALWTDFAGFLATHPDSGCGTQAPDPSLPSP